MSKRKVCCGRYRCAEDNTWWNNFWTLLDAYAFSLSLKFGVGEINYSVKKTIIS